MPRVARKNIVASYIHVITQGIRKEYIFRKDTYKEKYIELVKEKFAEIEGINLLCYCIMDNHAHFLIFTEKICELSKVMAKINCSFGRYYNKEEDRVGYVFRNRYKSQVIKNQGHLNNTLVYIHRNPVKANMVADMGQYKYSSYNDMKYGKWDEKAILLLFQQKDYLDRFVNIHKNFVHKNFNEDNFLEIREDFNSNEDIKIFLNQFCKENNIKCDDIKKDNYLLVMVIEQIKSRYVITDKQIIEVLGIGKNRITNIKKHCK